MADNPVVVTRENSAGAFVAAFVAVLLIALAVWYFGFRPVDGASGAGTDVNVTVDDGSGTGGQTTPEPSPEPTTPGY
jgi:hypothetical protein